MSIKCIVVEDLSVNAAESAVDYMIPWFKNGAGGIFNEYHTTWEQQPKFTQARKLFDQMKLTGVKMEFRPNDNLPDLKTLWTVDEYNMKTGENPIVEGNAIQMNGYKQLSTKRGWKKYIRLWKNLKGKGLGWVNTTTTELQPNSNLPQEYQNQPVWGFTQISGVYNNLDEDVRTIGRVTLTYYVKFKASKVYGDV